MRHISALFILLKASLGSMQIYPNFMALNLAWHCLLSFFYDRLLNALQKLCHGCKNFQPNRTDSSFQLSSACKKRFSLIQPGLSQNGHASGKLTWPGDASLPESVVMLSEVFTESAHGKFFINDACDG